MNRIDSTSNYKGSIFGYRMDPNRYMHKDDCWMFTPPFLAYIPNGIRRQDTDHESDLKNLNIKLSKCDEYDYKPSKAIEKMPMFEENPEPYNNYPNNRKECKESIVSNYIPIVPKMTFGTAKNFNKPSNYKNVGILPIRSANITADVYSPMSKNTFRVAERWKYSKPGQRPFY